MTVVRQNFEIRVGVFTTIALLLLLWGWGWLKSITWFHNPQRFTIQFHDVAGLNKNATININGVRVGIVEDIELKSAGQVLVHAKITTPNIVVPQGSHVTIQTLGLVGAKYLEVTMPQVVTGQPSPQPITSDEIVVGEDPVRIELILNDIGSFTKQMVTGMTGQHLGTNIGLTVKNINDLSGKFNENMDNFKVAAQSVTKAADKFGNVADEAKSAAGNADTFFVEGKKSFSKVNKILDKPMFSSDLKDVVDKAKQASDQIATAMHDINATLKNDNTRHDLITIMDKLNRSTENIAHSVETISNLAHDREIRGDIKETVVQAKEAISKVDAILNKEEFKGDLHATISKIKTAASDVDTAALQLQQVLNKRSPLLHMMFGRPGKLQSTDENTDQSLRDDTHSSSSRAAPVQNQDPQAKGTSLRAPTVER